MNQSQKKQLRDFVAGIKLYSSHSISKHLYNGDVVLEEGTTKVFKYGNKGKPILIIPSLINKASILDISKDFSFILRLKNLGFLPYLIVWNDPEGSELEFNLDDYQKRLVRIIKNLDKKFIILGYCMGGIMALKAFKNIKKQVSRIITIATPWAFTEKKFDAFGNADFSFLKSLRLVPKEFIRDIFYFADLSAANNKYIKLGKGEINLDEFAMIENWVNDGINMSLNLFYDLQNMIKSNSLNECNLAEIDVPCFNIIGQFDSVCPISTTIPLPSKLPNATAKFYDSGHVGLIIKDKHNIAADVANWCNI